MSCTHMILEAESQCERKGYSIFKGEVIPHKRELLFAAKDAYILFTHGYTM